MRIVHVRSAILLLAALYKLFGIYADKQEEEFLLIVFYSNTNSELIKVLTKFAGSAKRWGLPRHL
jgi:hypothetical protein